MKSWMTSLFGFLAAIGGIISQTPAVPSNVRVIAGIAGSVGVAGLGLVAKDSNVTGGTKVQASSEDAKAAVTTAPAA